MNKIQILTHIKSARLWLDKAEKFLENNNIVRAIGALFLADAEIKTSIKQNVKIKEKKQMYFSSRYKYTISKLSLAASILILVGLITYLYMDLTEKPKVITKIVEKPTKVIVKVPVERKDMSPKKEIIQQEKIIYRYVVVKKEEKENIPVSNIVKIPTVIVDEKQNKIDLELTETPSSEKKFFSEDEITELVKIAEKSLKGVQ